ncbi:rhodanese-like domain-containing protein [Pontibacter sp. JAM-7]|uniref:rhodanese-like domain-containing protein n=1 Tax=Pontibacter sp. JAM-7 TaxID=3366581 RepID=UPI003AF97D12
MSQTLTTSAAQLVTAARGCIQEYTAAEVISMLDKPQVLIVDLRDVRERERSGFIPGSFHCPRGMAEFWIDPESPYYKPFFGEGKQYIFHCASGWRSALTVKALQEMGMTNIAHISDGFTGWITAKGPIEPPASNT